MSWIQNLLQRLKNDDEDEWIESDIHSETREKQTVIRNFEYARDIEARISYQYPKTAFRLPVKTEEKSNPKLTPKPKSTPTPNQKPVKEPYNYRRTETHINRKKPEQTEEPSIKTEMAITRREQPKVKSSPFHPTDIPSPIFGFERPKKNKPELIEHELSHFYNEKEEPVFSKDEKEVKAESIPIMINLVNHESNQNVIEEPPQEEKVEILPVPQVDTPALHTPEESEATPVLHTPEEPEAPPVLDEPAQELVMEESRSKRSHLPFNVMMLKQDKLKWEEKKRNRKVEQSASKPVEMKQVEMKQVEMKQVEMPQQLSPVEEVHKEEREIPSYNGDYEFPVAELLNPPISEGIDTEWIQLQEELLNQTLKNFNVGAKVVNVTQGPSVTRFEVQPEPGVKVNKITNLSDDIKLSLAARDIRIEAPIPGKHTIGIEVPNQKSRPVLINEIIQSEVFKESLSPLTAVLGLDISGKPIVTDLKKMPHGLIAGATGSGKSVCINSILVSLLYKASPEDLRLLLIDPKVVELAPYNRIPHLVSPVITDVKAATASLKWAVDEMERRYELFAHTGVRDINRFNEVAIKHKRYSDKLPFIVIIIDELADLMMMSPADVEEAICRIAQKARACGIHLIVATQRPSVDVITGLIKANIPTRIAFSVSSQIDSRTIIDISGAEKLLGRGDMLFLENGSSKPVRLQGTFVSDEEIDLVVEHVREQQEPQYLFEQDELLKKAQITEEEDELFYEACEFIISQGGASTSSLQRRFKIGYNRAARLMDMLESNGFISGANGSKPREVLITETELESLLDASMVF